MGPAAPDSLLFSAKTFIIKYDPRVMLGGRLEATQIIVQKPHVHLTENVDTGAWNWYRLVHRKRNRVLMWLTAAAHHVLFVGITGAVWAGHRRALRAGASGWSNPPT